MAQTVLPQSVMNNKDSDAVLYSEVIKKICLWGNNYSKKTFFSVAGFASNSPFVLVGVAKDSEHITFIFIFS